MLVVMMLLQVAKQFLTGFKKNGKKVESGAMWSNIMLWLCVFDLVGK
jgi:hypothetical protein